MRYQRRGLSHEQLKAFYRHLLLPRLIEEKMLIALRQGRISKWFSGYGQEAISVGAALAMAPDEYLLPMHRNLGMFTTRQVPLEKLFAQFLGKEAGFTKGRDRSFHFGSPEHHLVGMISHLGPQLGIADGIALARQLGQEDKLTLVVTGDGGASEGDFHEALNVAAVWKLPVIFLIENNQWGLSTPSHEQFAFKSFVYKAIGYGVKGKSVDGNNLLEVYHALNDIRREMSETPVPFILECRTFRMRGHEEASGTKYYPEGLQDQWAKKDPIENFRAFLLNEGSMSPEENERYTNELKADITSAFDKAYALPDPTYDPEREKADLFAPHEPARDQVPTSTRELRFIDAIHEGLGQALEKHPELVLMGQDIADYGGVFKATAGLMEKYGKDRVRNTPLCEAAIIGSGLGLSIAGHKAMVEMQFADFVTEGFNQIVNNLAKVHYRWGQNADVVIRMPTGAGVAAGPFHSQSNEAWFTHTPGLKVAYPAFPEDAKGLLLEAFADPNPVLFFEHKALYRSVRGQVPAAPYRLPFGKARVLRKGAQATVITYGAGVHWMLELLEEQAYDLTLIDLRTLAPLDMDTLEKAVRRTGKALILQEDVELGGIASDLAARLTERCFPYLDAPIQRVTSENTPVPFAPTLEQGFLARRKLQPTLESLLAY
jgi:2-oxoisovalerate dehydrogenase E1 component